MLFLLLVLGGCVQKVDWASLQRRTSLPAGDLYQDHSLAQTFVSHHSGLSGIEVLVVDYGLDGGRPATSLELRLCREFPCAEALAEATIHRDTIYHNQSFRFSFPPQADSAGKTYVLVVMAPQAVEPARATLWAHDADLYVEGGLLLDGEPASGDLTFWVYYDMGASDLLGELLRRAGAGLGHLPALFLLLLAPGYLLVRLLPRFLLKDPFELLGACLGLSVAAVPLLLLLLSQTPLVLSGPPVLIGGMLLGAASLGLLFRDLSQGLWAGLRMPPAPLVVALVGVLVVSLSLRAVHAFDLSGPPWVDAVHHSLLTRLIIERGAIPTDYYPYIDVAPATYHFGFQSLVAVLHWLTGMALPDALLLLGQVLSGLAGLPLYALGRRWGGSRWAGLGAALVPSSLSLMPAYYLSWSRYTQLAGLVILPLAAILLGGLIRRRRWDWGLMVVLTVALAGLFLTHLRVAAFLVALVGLLLIAETIRRRYRWQDIALPWGRTLLVAVLTVVLTWPWLWPSFRHLVLPAVQKWEAGVDHFSLYFILFGPGRWVAPVAALGTALALFWRRREALLLLFWVGALLLLANPHLVGLHMGAVVDNLSVTISLYVPIALGIALALGGVVAGGRNVGRRALPWLRWLATVLLLVLGLWGAHNLRAIVNSSTVLLAEADREAMVWIEQNVAPESLFLIQSLEWMADVYAGSDGGCWITPLTGRRTWPPPALYGLGTAEYIEEINQLAQTAMAGTAGEDLYDLLQPCGFTHVYLGRYGGSLKPDQFINRPHFRPVYQKHGVWIFALEP